MNNKKFFDKYKEVFGKLNQSQVDGINLILQYQNEIAQLSIPQFAYVLATAYHETNAKMQPVKEAYWIKPESLRIIVLKKMYRRFKAIVYADGRIFYGRGHVQVTHDYNYKRVGKMIGVGDDLFNDPDKILQPNISVAALFEGMKAGIFTTKKLSDYLRGNIVTTTDLYEARKIVNGKNKAMLIAGYAKNFIEIINYSLT